MATQKDDSCHVKTQAGVRTPNSYQALRGSEATLGDLQNHLKRPSNQRGAFRGPISTRRYPPVSRGA
jgi:hypothetical protein